MKTLRIVILLFVVTLSATATTSNIDNLSARSDGNAITVEWRAKSETGVKNYELERASDNGSYARVFSQATRGAGFIYRFVDEEAILKGKAEGASLDLESNQISKYNNTFSGSKYTYRVKINFSDNTIAYTDEAVVTHNVSSVRRTWGMLKEMFR